MDPTQALHNLHWRDPHAFPARDPQLARLASQPLVHVPRLLAQLPTELPGIYSIGGARQIGKTTLVKQWMAQLLSAGVAPRAVAFLTGELIDDHHALVRQVRDLLDEMPRGRRFVAVDEITYVRNWDRGIKFLADAGLLEETVVVLTGSDLALMREARARFPGRRGRADRVDFHLHPLAFREVVELRRGQAWASTARARQQVEVLFAELESYLQHGGFLTAINDHARAGRIEPSTLRTYADWIRGDVSKRRRHEHTLREVLGAILGRLGSQVTWNALGRELSIDHPQTVQDYVSLLERMDAVFVQPALREDRLSAAPKKARKVMFTDPFIGHAVADWLRPATDPYRERIEPLSASPAKAAPWVEAVVATHFARLHPTYYIKAKGEVDVAYVADGRFHPVEVKWGTQIRPKELVQVARYPNGRVWGRVRTTREVGGVTVEPLAQALFDLEPPD